LFANHQRASYIFSKENSNAKIGSSKNMSETFTPSAKNILIVDLNNEAPFPTLAVGYRTTPLKKAGYNIEVYSPLAFGVSPLTREVEETLLNYLAVRIRLATHPLIEWTNDLLYNIYTKVRFRPTRPFVDKTKEVIKAKSHDLILVSAYLQYDRLFKVIAAQAKSAGIPLLLGGSIFQLSRGQRTMD
jgi:anaerobic magnesium-protoporphyrin IX monomethyl ester cyclase